MKIVDKNSEFTAPQDIAIWFDARLGYEEWVARHQNKWGYGSSREAALANLKRETIHANTK